MCSNWAGFALTNTAVIGEQGSPTSAIGNWWRQSSLLGCDPWGGQNAPFQTYCENSDPMFSKLWVINVSPNYNPNWNAGNPLFYSPGISPNIDIAPINRLSDCTGNHIYGPPPNWRLTSIDKENTNEPDKYIRIYPNPSENDITIESLHNISGSILRVYSISGVELMTKNISEYYKTRIDISELLPALYFVRITDKAGSVSNFKLIKSN